MLCVEVPRCLASAVKAGYHCHTFPVLPLIICCDPHVATEEPAKLRVGVLFGRRDSGAFPSVGRWNCDHKLAKRVQFGLRGGYEPDCLFITICSLLTLPHSFP